MRANSISVTLPVEHAFERVKRVLFQPFDLSKWFTIGFCAWLAYLGEGGGGGGGGGFHGMPGRHAGSQGVRDMLVAVRDYVLANLWWILPVIAGGILIGVAIGALILWLSSRGRFMFLDCVARNRAAIREPWAVYRVEGNSLFLFRIILAVATMLPMLFLLAVAGVCLWEQIMAGAVLPGPMVGLAGACFSLVVFGIVFWIVNRFTVDFVVPLQYLRKYRVLDAWRELLPVLSRQAGIFVLYLLFRILIAVAMGAILLIAMLVTCCLAGCVMAIPYIGTVLILPLLVFERSYSLYFFAQFGHEFDVFSFADNTSP